MKKTYNLNDLPYNLTIDAVDFQPKKVKFEDYLDVTGVKNTGELMSKLVNYPAESKMKPFYDGDDDTISLIVTGTRLESKAEVEARLQRKAGNMISTYERLQKSIKPK